MRIMAFCTVHICQICWGFVSIYTFAVMTAETHIPTFTDKQFSRFFIMWSVTLGTLTSSYWSVYHPVLPGKVSVTLVTCPQP